MASPKRDIEICTPKSSKQIRAIFCRSRWKEDFCNIMWR
ncbi:hypothetical protein CCACVL1_07585, partial [Corchorus capsularis]